MNHLLVVRGYLRGGMSNNGMCPLSGHTLNVDKGKQGFQECPGNTRDISRWLDKETGTVMKKSKIADILKIADNLDEEILEDVEKQSHARGEKQDDSVGVKIATSLATFEDKQEQKDLRGAIQNSRESHQDIICKSITAYKQAPEKIKQQIRQGQLDIADVEDAITIQELHKESESRYIFIPNFTSQMRQFDRNVMKLEDQVSLFKDIFHSTQFKEKYNVLKTNQKEKLNVAILDIHKRIKQCYDEIDFFLSQLENETVLSEGKHA